MQSVNISFLLSGSRLTADLYQANTLPAPELGLIFESKGEIQLESVCKSFAYLRKKPKKTKTNVLCASHIYKASQFMAWADGLGKWKRQANAGSRVITTMITFAFLEEMCWISCEWPVQVF